MHTDGAELKDGDPALEERAADDSTSLTAAFERPAARRHVERAGELFLIATAGFALAGALGSALPGSGAVNGVTTTGALGAAVLSAPLLGTLTGVLTGLQFEGDPGEVLAVAGAGAGLGAVICGGLVYFAAFATAGTGVEFSIGSLVALAVGTAVAGGLAGLVVADGR